MHINIILLAFIIVFGLVMIYTGDNKKNRLTYIICCGVILVLVAALRSPDWMTFKYNIDTLSYKNDFDDISEISWLDIWGYANQRYVGGQGDYDVGFIGLMKFISIFTGSFYIFSIIADLLFFIPFCIILYRYSTNIRQLIFAFVFYVALVQIFMFGGARQMFAIGFDLMAFIAVTDRKKWRAIFFLLIGVLIHFSSFLFVIPLLLIWFNVKPKKLKTFHALCFISFPIVLLFPQQLILFMGAIVGMEKYSNYGMGEIQGGATTFIFLIELLSLFCLFAFKKKDLENDSSVRFLYVMAPLFTLFAPLIYADGSMIRVSLYYHLFLSLLVPYGLEYMFKENNKILVYSIAILGLTILTLSGGGVEYYFFWQK